MSKYAIGIDLGTTYSSVSVWKHEKYELIPNELGKFSTPSMVAFTEKEIMIGDTAKNQIMRNYENTIFDSKRLIGRKYSEKQVQEDKKFWPFKVINDENDRPLIEVNYKGKSTFSPEEISSMILKNLKKNADDYIGQEVKDSIITVPANFNDSQRQSTINAAKIAGLNVVQIINEPTAAALTFGLEFQSNKKRNVCMFDLGGGTFDITIIEIENRTLKVIATGGDSHLGGEDFDNALVNYCVEEFKKKNKIDISNNRKALLRLKIACEKAKIALSSLKETNIDIDCLAEGEDFVIDITRTDFEECCDDLFLKCLKTLKETIYESNLKEKDIDEVVLVGGSSRIPKIREIVQKHFKLNKLNLTINPDFAVAAGAGIKAGIYTKLPGFENLEVKDVNPLSLGVSTIGGKMSIIIPKNTLIPCSEYKRYKTIYDNQPNFIVGIYQGENEFFKDNYKLDFFCIENIRKAPKGEVILKITFSLDKDSILAITAEEEGNKNNFKHLVVKRAEINKEIELRFKLGNLLDRILSKNKNNSDIEKKVLDLKNWLNNSQTLDPSVYESKIQEVQKYLNIK